MNGAGLTTLNRPQGSSLRIDPNLHEPQSDGFNFPEFKLVRKKNRVLVSGEELSIGGPHLYKLFVTASTKGWFVAATNNAVICSPLKDLNDILEGDDTVNPMLTAKRTVALPAQPIVLAFTTNESRLAVALTNGDIHFFASAQLFSDAEDVNPIYSLTNSSSPARQIVANPSSEAELADMFAIVRLDGSVEILDSSFQSQGGWTAGEQDAVVVAVSWSPKGKQVALGLRLGDIVCFTPSQKTQVQKHVPPTCNIKGQLASLTWLPGIGYNFRTSYAPAEPDADVSTHHGVHVDNKASLVQVTEFTHPYRLPGRPNQNAYVSVLPKWDQDSAVLLVVGDMSSSDIEVFGRANDQWFYHYQENQMTVPLNDDAEDLVLLSLEVDLCNSTGNPILYAYLNDGSVQAWSAHHNKPYVGMVKADVASTTPQTQTEAPQSAFGQPSSAPSPFGQPTSQPSSFGQPSMSPFGLPQTVSTPSPFGMSQPVFGGGQPQQTSAFGQPAFGQPPTFGGGSSGSGSGNGAPAIGAFGGGQKQSVFGGGQQQSVLGGNNQQSAFGSGSGGFGSNANQPSTAEDSMAEDAPSFAGLSLGEGSDSSNLPKTTAGGLFGSMSPTIQPNQPSGFATPAFGGTPTIKPGSGFGAFGGAGTLENSPFAPKNTTNGGTSAFGSSTSAFSGGSTGQPQPSAFAGIAPSAPAFGQPAFGQTSKPVFGQSSFGQTSFGRKPTTPAATVAPSSSGGFSAFASGGPSSFTTAASANKPVSTGGFGAFASAGPSGFGSKPAGTSQPPAFEDSKPPGFAAFASGGQSAFGTKPTTSEPAKPTGFAGFASDGASAFNITPKPAEKTAATSTSNAFGAFASGGPSAFGAPTSSGTETPKTVFDATETKPQTSASDSGVASVSSAFMQVKKEEADSSTFSTTPQSSPFSGTSSTLQSSPFGKGAFTSPSPSSRTEEPSKSAFQTTTPQSSPFSGGSGFAGIQNSPFGKGAFGSASPSPTAESPSSPSSTSFGTPSKTPPTGNAFSNLKASTIQPAQGFGAFGNTVHDESSPFFRATETKPPQVSAFGTPSKANTPVASATTTPTFGAPTAIGVHSTFASSVTPSTTPTKAPVIGGFGSYTAGTSVFGKVAESKAASFEDLLAGKKGEEPVKPSTKADSQEQLFKTAPSTPPTKAEDEKGKGKENDEETISKASGSMSSVGSSYVDVSHEENEDDYDESFLSDTDDEDYEEDEDDHPDEEEESQPEEEPDGELEEDEETLDKSPTPTQIPLPSSRSASSTPQPETSLPTIVEETTTPPGSPEKDTSPPKPSATPLPSLGLGRPPNTRPARSSPLANAVSDSEEEEQEEVEVKPAVPKPRPASPRTPFGVLPLKTEPETSTKPRPKTPPLLSAFGGGAGIFGKPAVSAPAPSSDNIQGPVSIPLPKPTVIPPPPPFASPSPPDKPASPSQGTMPPPRMPVFSAPPPTQVSLTGGLFGRPPGVSPPAGFVSLTSKTPTQQPQLAPQAAIPVQPPLQQPLAQSAPQRVNFDQDAYEEGMQRECARVFSMMTQELEILRALAVKANGQREAYSRRLGGSSAKAELGDPRRWAPADAQKFKETLSTYAEDLEAIQESNASAKAAAKELSGGLVRAHTRKEEIDRFKRAKEDEDFKRMLKARSLGPELVEAKARLRGELIRKRQEIERLEQTVVENKKKMSAVKNQRGVFRAPSLDTVNRTYRNIDTAIRQEQATLESLRKRVAAVNLSASRQTSNSPSVGPPARDARLPDVKHPPQVASYAVTTAAALNAERSAQKLKNALFNVRQEPLLNRPKATRTVPPVAFLSSSQAEAENSPSKTALIGGVGPNFNTPIKIQGSLFDDQSPGAFDFNDAGDVDFQVKDHLSPTTRSRKQKTHGGGLFKGATTPPPPPAFNWGPLPSFDYGKKGGGGGGPFVSLACGKP